MSTGNNDELADFTDGLPSHETLSLYDPETRSLFASIIILLKVYPVLMLLMGSFGNLLSFCVLLRPAMRRYSTFCYLACLALVDLGVIITFCVSFISLYHFEYNIQDRPFPCKLFAFCIYFLPQYSSWILVAVSIDRVISAKYLRLAKTWTKPKHSVLVTFLLGLFLAILNSHFFLYVKQRTSSQTNTPTVQQRVLTNHSVIERLLTPETFAQQHGYFAFINTFSSSTNDRTGGGGGGVGDASLAYESFTPPPPQLVSRETTLQDQFENAITIKQQSIPFFDVNMIHCSLEHSKAHTKLYLYWVWIDLAMNVFIPFTAMIACTIIIIFTLVRSSSRAGSTSARRSRRRRNISVMLITVNLVFIILTAPIVIFLSIYEYVKEDNNFYRQTVLILIKILCIILMNLNHSVNIIIYSLTAKEFRSELTHFFHTIVYCVIGKPVHPADLPYIHNDGTISSRFRHLRYHLFQSCRVKMRSSSTNTTDSSGLQHTTAPRRVNVSRLSNSNKLKKRRRSDRNGHLNHLILRQSETSIHRNCLRLTVQMQADPTSSVCEREDLSFRGLSISTED